MTHHTPKGFILLIIGLISACIIVRVHESSFIRSLFNKWSGMNRSARYAFLTLLVLCVIYAGDKPESVNIPVTQINNLGLQSCHTHS